MILDTLEKEPVSMVFVNDMEGKLKDQITLEYWMCPLNHWAYKFLIKLEKILVNFEKKVTFVPKIKFMDMKDKNSDDLLWTKCYSKGEFCSESKTMPLEALDEGIW